MDTGKTAYVTYQNNMSKRRDINLFPTANSPPCLCGFYSAHNMDCRHAMSYLAALGQMKDMAEFNRVRVPAYYWWSTYCAAFEDVAIISPNLAKIDKIVDIISIDTAPPCHDPCRRTPAPHDQEARAEHAEANPEQGGYEHRHEHQ